MSNETIKAVVKGITEANTEEELNASVYNNPLAFATGYKLGKEYAIHEVSEIIDRHAEKLVGDIIDCKFQEIIAADVLASVREDVLALKGGDEE